MDGAFFGCSARGDIVRAIIAAGAVLARTTREKILADLRRNKRNRTLEEAQHILELYGFSYRPGSKEQGGVWKRGSQTITLPRPHGRIGGTLGPTYIKIVIQVIDAAEAESALEDQQTVSDSEAN